ncbi:P34 probable thiol protease-like [Neltuma alba]|uniref:P34 probable thiol protease-like n=1 Tax=Neltuma alba TaxID=207710 RepID=UPI0010A5478E|nr:P34 probable thiol protease-like [Prosopis alba]
MAATKEAMSTTHLNMPSTMVELPHRLIILIQLRMIPAITKRGRKTIALTVDEYQNVTSTKSENPLFCAVARQPVSVHTYAGSKDFQRYHHGLFNGSGCSEVAPYYINHVMLIVGYDSFGPGLDYRIVKNSWGKTWGEQGYIKIKRNIGHHLGVCNINCWGYYPTKKNVKLDSAT